MTRGIAVLMIAWAAVPAQCEPPPDPRPREEQTLFFRAVLHELRVEAVTDFQELMQSPEKKALIVLGPTNLLNSLIPGGTLSRFLTSGGSVLIASDQSTSPNVSTQIGARIDGRQFTGQFGDVYRNSLHDCPLLHEVRRKERPTESHPIFRDLPDGAHIATNRPSLLYDWNRGNNYRQIAVIDAPLAAGLRGPTVQGYRTFGVVAEFPKGGRLLVLADHSLFIDMMVQPDNHNLDFTIGVLRWLTEDGQRSRVLMIDNDAIQTSFNVSLVRPPMPPMPSIRDLLPIISQRFSELQREDQINKMIQRAVPHSTFLRRTAGLLTLVLLAAGAYCFLHARQRGDLRPKPATAPTEPPASLGSSYVESARELAAEVFRANGWEPRTSREPPTVAVAADGASRRQWQSQIHRLWAAARGEKAVNSAAGLQRVHAECHAVRSAIQSGVVSFAVKS